jgi:metal-sulfur cluster biosynthetic enzyme
VRESDIFEVLDTVMDPCGISAGVPLSICEMGLFTGLDLGDHGSLQVLMRPTTPGCFEGRKGSLPRSRHELVLSKGVESVSVDFSDGNDWTEEDVSEDGRRRLSKLRGERRARLPHPVVQQATSKSEEVDQ